MANIIGSNGADTLIGGAEDDEISGLDANDRLEGRAGFDLLEGGAGQDLLIGGADGDALDGGSGADEMRGGGGNDAYRVDDSGDVPVEQSGAGFDGVFISVDWTLQAHFEDLIMEGSGNLSGIGNNVRNLMFGNSGDNRLEGKGGNDDIFGDLGNDALYGGDGGDYMAGDSGDDTVDGGSGNDTIFGDDRFNQLDTGNDLLLGGSGNDSLFSGQGIDTLQGGKGNDQYFIDGGDTLVELSDQGYDVVNASSSWTLGAHFEELRIDFSEEDAIAADGNELDNIVVVNGFIDFAHLRGKDGDDFLSSNLASSVIEGGEGEDELWGGFGADRLEGGADEDFLNGGGGANVLSGGGGADRFSFSGFEAVSTITDFNGNVDRLEIVKDVLADLDDTGRLSSRYFHAGTAAQTEDHRLIYDANAGALYYDADGSGVSEQVQILNLAVPSGIFNAQDIYITNPVFA